MCVICKYDSPTFLVRPNAMQCNQYTSQTKKKKFLSKYARDEKGRKEEYRVSA